MRVAGIGFRKAATVASLRDALSLVVGDGPPVQAVATEVTKSEAQVFVAFADQLGLAMIGVASDDLQDAQTQTRSAHVMARFGTGSICEAAALIGAGPDARLVAARVISSDKMATAAIAESEGIQT